ncbi:hypothetical protein [Desulfofundulus thermosubterraneus]|uniref:Uncharacterized protein n=1 Tax=Desulfofundulus thermosubterraneus DSM 16057 TaxID=1121432 RepID=A0A1M6C6E2_9FIRM|nr:hypothetical protein [Desulfofundulus thermosubterraneus]SHI56314.1 hypothetical protein SAMN02745219_00604 [Desulfofundulus thermosubterraneus DSM 16057]
MQVKINLNREEYELLIEIFYIADWVLNAYKTTEDDEIDRYRDLEQKILSRAKEFGLQNIVEWDPSMRVYQYTREFEENNPAMEFIEDFEEDTFWDELVERLSMRDLVEEYGEESVMEMDVFTRLEKLDKYRVKYLEEFEKNGLQNVQVF